MEYMLQNAFIALEIKCTNRKKNGYMEKMTWDYEK